MQFHFNKSLYEKRALFTAAYKFTDRSYLHLDLNDTDYIVDVEMKPGTSDISPQQFQNEILAAMVRLDINKRTKNVRELLLARALASTFVSVGEKDVDCIDQGDNILKRDVPEVTGEDEWDGDQEDIDDILTDWFEKYE